MTWASVSDLARERGVSKQAISKRLASLAGQVPTQKGPGGRLLINVEAFTQVTDAETDPAQDLRNRDLPGRAPEPVSPATAPPQQPAPGDALAKRVFSTQRAKREGYEAELSRIALEEKLGRLLPIRDVEDAMVKLATVMIRVIDAMPAEVEDPTARAVLKRKAVELRQAIADGMKTMAIEPEGTAA